MYLLAWSAGRRQRLGGVLVGGFSFIEGWPTAAKIYFVLLLTITFANVLHRGELICFSISIITHRPDTQAHPCMYELVSIAVDIAALEESIFLKV